MAKRSFCELWDHGRSISSTALPETIRSIEDDLVRPAVSPMAVVPSWALTDIPASTGWPAQTRV